MGIRFDFKIGIGYYGYLKYVNMLDDAGLHMLGMIHSNTHAPFFSDANIEILRRSAILGNDNKPICDLVMAERSLNFLNHKLSKILDSMCITSNVK